MDIRSKDILKQALKAYDGTLLIVSHDRDFLEGLVDKLYEFRDGKVTEHLGGVEEFLRKRRLESLNELERKAEPAPQRESRKNAPETVTASREEFQQRKFISREERKVRNRIAFLEKGIEELETRMKEIEQVLASPGPSDDIMELTRQYLELKRDLDAKTEEWGRLIEQIS